MHIYIYNIQHEYESEVDNPSLSMSPESCFWRNHSPYIHTYLHAHIQTCINTHIYIQHEYENEEDNPSLSMSPESWLTELFSVVKVGQEGLNRRHEIKRTQSAPKEGRARGHANPGESVCLYVCLSVCLCKIQIGRGLSVGRSVCLSVCLSVRAEGRGEDMICKPFLGSLSFCLPLFFLLLSACIRVR
jgi:hypothetical protein